jgi:hypothetical protein
MVYSLVLALACRLIYTIITVSFLPMVVKYYGNHRPTVLTKILQLGRMQDGGFLTLVPVRRDCRFFIDDLGGCEPSLRRGECFCSECSLLCIATLTSVNVPSLIRLVFPLLGNLVLRNFGELARDGVLDEVFWFEDFGLEDGLDAVVDVVVVDVAVDALLSDFVLDGLDVLVSDGWGSC